MRKITEQDLTAIIGLNINGYTVKKARIKTGEFSDSDHYGIILAKSESGLFITWQFHFVDGWIPEAYWGNYMSSPEAALTDYETRS